MHHHHASLSEKYDRRRRMEDLLLLFLSLIIRSLLTFICMAILPVPIYILPSSIIILSFPILNLSHLEIPHKNCYQKLIKNNSIKILDKKKRIVY